MMYKFTQQGVEAIKEGPARTKAAKAALEAAGGKMVNFYLTMGRYDAVVVCQLPNDETVMKLLLDIGSQGNVRSETMRAFTEGEYRELVAGLP
jgi:uncharacterized protein with GYD domain